MILYFLLFLSKQVEASDFSPRIPTAIFDQLVGSRDRFYYGSPTVEVSFAKGPPQSIKLPEGGGVFDFAEILTSKKELFLTVRFKFDGLPESLESLQVFFVGRYKPLKISGLQFGASCSNAYDLSRHFKPGGRFFSSGIELSGLPYRYANTMGGDWYFAWQSEGETYVSLIRVVDSRASQLEKCEGVTE